MWLERRRASARAMLIGSAALLGACAASAEPARLVAADPAARDAGVVPRADGDAITEHVVVISIDGLRPDAIERSRARTLLRLMAEGSYSLNAKTIMPSRTLPSHTSMLTGEKPEAHGITWNSNESGALGYPAVPTIFARARNAGLRTAAFFGKGKFNHLNVPNTLDHVEVPEGNEKWTADRTVAGLERHLADESPNLVFVHLTDPDAAGHTFSWMSWFYGRAVRKADAAVARVLEAADGAYGVGRYTVIVTADHGGHGWVHGSSDPRDTTIPWIVWGRGVRAAGVLPDGIRTMDTAATVLWILGLEHSGVGEPVRTAFEALARSDTALAGTQPARNRARPPARAPHPRSAPRSAPDPRPRV